MISFTDYHKELKLLENCIDTSESVEQFFEMLEECGLGVSNIMCTDVGDITEKLANKKTNLYERAPSGKKAESWINSMKNTFKRRYGDKWERVLYATAWKLFPEK